MREWRGREGAYTGLMATKSVSACFGPGWDRGSVSTTLKGAPAFSTTSPLCVAMAAVVSRRVGWATGGPSGRDPTDMTLRSVAPTRQLAELCCGVCVSKTCPGTRRRAPAPRPCRPWRELAAVWGPRPQPGMRAEMPSCRPTQNLSKARRASSSVQPKQDVDRVESGSVQAVAGSSRRRPRRDGQQDADHGPGPGNMFCRRTRRGQPARRLFDWLPACAS